MLKYKHFTDSLIEEYLVEDRGDSLETSAANNEKSEIIYKLIDKKNFKEDGTLNITDEKAITNFLSNKIKDKSVSPSVSDFKVMPTLNVFEKSDDKSKFISDSEEGNEFRKSKVKSIIRNATNIEKKI